jgi:TonB family protein
LCESSLIKFAHAAVRNQPKLRRLDEQAIKAVKTWKFKPATLDDKPVAVQITLEVTFGLY